MILKNNFFLILALLFFCVSGFLLQKPNPIKRSDYLPQPTFVQYLSAGLKIQNADSFWLRAVQDFDHCDQPVNERECRGKSWLYEVLNLTTDLDTQFKQAYYYGGLALTIIISDYAGASKIFDKGVKQFPNVWFLSYAAGYHAIFEEKDKLKGSRLFLAAAKNGGPSWLWATAGRLAADGGDKQTANQILNEMLATSEDPKLIERLKKKIKETED